MDLESQVSVLGEEVAEEVEEVLDAERAAAQEAGPEGEADGEEEPSREEGEREGHAPVQRAGGVWKRCIGGVTAARRAHAGGAVEAYFSMKPSSFSPQPAPSEALHSEVEPASSTYSCMYFSLPSSSHMAPLVFFVYGAPS